MAVAVPHTFSDRWWNSWWEHVNAVDGTGILGIWFWKELKPCYPHPREGIDAHTLVWRGQHALYGTECGKALCFHAANSRESCLLHGTVHSKILRYRICASIERAQKIKQNCMAILLKLQTSAAMKGQTKLNRQAHLYRTVASSLKVVWPYCVHPLLNIH